MAKASAEEQFRTLTETPIPKLTFMISVPAIVSTMITTVYNMADTWFVARLGTSATGAIGVAFSIMTFTNAIGFLFGMGSGTYISRLLGARKNEEANQIASTAFFTTIVLGILAAILGIANAAPLMRFLGASDTILPYAVQYGSVVMAGLPIMISSLVLSTILRCEGKTNLSMFGIGLGGVLNIGLDPLFIFAFGLGITGAAVATVVSQTTGFLILLGFYLTGRSVSKISIRNVRIRRETYRHILVTGTPSLTRHLIGTIANIAMNVAAGPFGDAAIAAMAIVMKVGNLAMCISNGIAQGGQTIYAFNKGAKRYDRVRETYRFALTVNTCLMIAWAGISLALAPQIMALFRADDADVIRIGALAMRVTGVGMILLPFNSMANQLFQSVGESGKSTFLAALRQGIYYIPIVLILPRVIGLTGLQIALPICDVLTCATCLPFIVDYFKKLAVEEAKQKQERSL